MHTLTFKSHHDLGDDVAASQPRALIYFICGNPGLINFYNDFLGILAESIRASSVTRAYEIFGRDLLGFNDDDHEPFSQRNLPWDLEAQIEGMYKDVAERASGGDYEFVVLMGHSVGAYIATEIMHRHMRAEGKAQNLDLRHAILLFPTLTHIARSRNGTRMAFLQRLPFIDAHFHVIARAFLSCLSESMACWVAETVMGFSPQAARVLGRWLKSRDGVWQAVHLGKSELATIREDVWGKELWDIARSSEANKGVAVPKFFFFYGKDDEWVANKTRDEFIDSRKETGAKAVIDKGDIPHAFCTKEGEFTFHVCLR